MQVIFFVLRKSSTLILESLHVIKKKISLRFFTFEDTIEGN